MPKIKTRESHKDIKVLDKAAVAGERMKNAFIRSKDTAAYLMDDGQITPDEYAEDRVQYAAEDIAHNVGHTATKEGKKLAQKGRDAIRKHRDHPKEPGQVSEQGTPQQTPQEQARRSRIQQAETRAGERYQSERHGVSQYGYAEPTLYEETSPQHQQMYNPIANHETTPVGTSDSRLFTHYPQSEIHQTRSVEVQSEVSPRIKQKSGFEQPSSVEDAPIQTDIKFRANQLMQGREAVNKDRSSPGTELPDHSLGKTEEVGPTLKDQPIQTESEAGPKIWDYPSRETEEVYKGPSVYSDHSHTRPQESGKGIKTPEKRLSENRTEIKQLTPTERGRQFAIKQAEKRAETVRAAQNRPALIMEDGSKGYVPIEAESIPQPVFSHGEPSQDFSPVNELKQDVKNQKKVTAAQNNALQKAEGNTKLARAPSDSFFYTDHVPSESAIVDRRDQRPRNLAKTTARSEKRQTKGSIKTVEKAEKTIKQSAQSTQKASIKTTRKTAKTSQKAVKTAEQTSKTAIKTAQATAKATQKSAQVAAKTAQKAAAAARQTARAAAVAAKAVAKAVAAAIKAIVAGVKELVAAIAAGGWVAVIAIVIICLIGVIIASPFGIFFSGNNRDQGAVTASAAVAQVMYDFNSKLEDLQDGDYDDITISGSLADWPEVLAVFAVKVAGNNDIDAMDVATLDQKRIKKLKDVFWDMNTISTEVETIDYPDSDPEDEVDDSWSESILNITITSKTAEEMKTQYHFSEKQKKMLNELLENRDALLELIGDLQFISTDAYELLKHLPDDLTEERRKVIKTACSLVGKVNYFWGGKSLVIGWDSRWGSIQKVWADGSPTTGTYRPYGLDCSGFVDWVFYNVSEGAYVIGHGGGAADQHAYCRAITWDESMPGDLVFFPEDSHVGIFAGRDDDGQLIIIHCGGNGVVVSDSDGFTSIARPLYYDE